MDICSQFSPPSFVAIFMTAMRQQNHRIMKPNILLYACSANCCSFNVTPNHYLCVFVHMCLILYILCIIMLFYAIHTFVCQRHFPFSLVVVFTHSIPLPRPWIGNVTVILPAVGMECLTEISRNLYFISYLSPNIMVYKPYNVE